MVEIISLTPRAPVRFDETSGFARLLDPGTAPAPESSPSFCPKAREVEILDLVSEGDGGGAARFLLE